MGALKNKNQLVQKKNDLDIDIRKSEKLPVFQKVIIQLIQPSPKGAYALHLKVKNNI